MDFHIKDILSIYKPRPLVRKTRKQWIQDFLVKVEGGWNAHKKEKLTWFELAKRMRNVPKGEEATLWTLCEESKSFTSFFWWRIKQYPRRVKEKKPKQETMKWKK